MQQPASTCKKLVQKDPKVYCSHVCVDKKKYCSDHVNTCTNHICNKPTMRGKRYCYDCNADRSCLC